MAAIEDRGTPKEDNDQKGDSENKAADKKQAVVLIHGIGEQIPMSTLRGFVDAVWSSDASLIPQCRPDGDSGQSFRVSNPVWTKPDKRNNSFELRRITTERMGGECICGKCEGHSQKQRGETDRPSERRTDFYEFYWADLMQDTTWSQTAKWLWRLFVRSPNRVPKDVRPIWIFVWTLIIAIALTVFWLGQHGISLTSLGVFTTLLGSLAAAARGILKSYAGDVARYTHPDPQNVARRQEIRQKGIALLERLMGVTPEAIAANREKIKAAERAAMQSGTDPAEMDPFKPKWHTEYDRVVVVGHSLGAIVAYDLLAYSFARMHTALVGSERSQPKRAELESYCKEGLENPGSFTLEGYREKQRECYDELQEIGHPWLVSDLVTVGSPLTHADFLLADGWDDSMRQMSERRLPTCPPRLEWDRNLANPDESKEQQKTIDLEHFYFSFRPFDKDLATPESIENEAEITANPDHARLPHHAAHFAFSRWTNIFSPTRDILWGDLVSGKVGDFFGQRRPRIDNGPREADLLSDGPNELSLWAIIFGGFCKLIEYTALAAIVAPVALVALPLWAWSFAIASGLVRLFTRRDWQWLRRVARIGVVHLKRIERAVRRSLPRTAQPSPHEARAQLVGIKDIQVMPEDTTAPLGTQGGIFPHTRYWDHGSGKYRIEDPEAVPPKIRMLRQAINLRFDPGPSPKSPEAL